MGNPDIIHDGALGLEGTPLLKSGSIETTDIAPVAGMKADLVYEVFWALNRVRDRWGAKHL